MWGKAPYAARSDVDRDVNVYPFEDFPGPGDTDHGKIGTFDGDQYNGGISGIVHYSITRAENDPRWGGAEVWEPGIADVRVQLWDVTRTRLLNEVTTDSWDASQPTGCQGPVYTFLGQPKDCYAPRPKSNLHSDFDLIYAQNSKPVGLLQAPSNRT